MSDEVAAPAGWYPNPEDDATLRYWDGAAWTAHTAPVTPAAPTAGESEPDGAEPHEAEDETGPQWPTGPIPIISITGTDDSVDGGADADSEHSGGKPWYLRWWVIALAALVLVVVVAVIVNGLSSNSSNPPVVTTPVASLPAITSPAATPTVTSPSASTSVTSPATSSPTSSASSSSASATSTATGPTALVDGDWSAAKYAFTSDAQGRFSGTTSITYTGAKTSGASARLTFTVTPSSGVSVTLVGSIAGARPGVATTVDLVSADGYVVGPYTSVSFTATS